MNRRTVLLLALAGLGPATRLAAAQPAPIPTVGVLLTGSTDPEAYLASLRAALATLGYVDGRSISFAMRSADRHTERLPARAAELVALKVDVIVASLTPAIQAAKAATGTIPIVMAAGGDPVATGMVASLAKPGGNVTGISDAGAEVIAKDLELIRDLLPDARRVAVLANDQDPFTRPLLDHIAAGARGLDLTVDTMMTQPSAPLDAAFRTMADKRIEALIVQPSLQRNDVIDLALAHRLPTFSANRDFALAGGLISYAASREEMFQDAAGYVDKILHGRKPADLPVELPTRFELVINLKTAKALGIVIPPTLMARADDVIN